MNKFIPLLFIIATTAAPAAAARREDPDTQLARVLDGRVPGKPVNCISMATSTSSQIIDGRAIVYRIGGTVYVNRPRSGASTLRDDDVLVTRVFGSQLCSIDSIRLFDRTSRIPRGFVILDKFVPYTRPKV